MAFGHRFGGEKIAAHAGLFPCEKRFASLAQRLRPTQPTPIPLPSHLHAIPAAARGASPPAAAPRAPRGARLDRLSLLAPLPQRPPAPPRNRRLVRSSAAPRRPRRGR